MAWHEQIETMNEEGMRRTFTALHRTGGDYPPNPVKFRALYAEMNPCRPYLGQRADDPAIQALHRNRPLLSAPGAGHPTNAAEFVQQARKILGRARDDR